MKPGGKAIPMSIPSSANSSGTSSETANEVSDSQDRNKNLNPIDASKVRVDELADLVAERFCAYPEKTITTSILILKVRSFF
ncbi:MAG TPA: hypothetical protein VFA65_02185 [Bryobacteraceae bacterium]|nr:hypothetical protein [Bryobacteraceae bacterium]